MNRDVLPLGHELHWYKVQSLLGRGAFGVTYLAQDQNLDQLVAIKEYFPNQFSSRVTGCTVEPLTGEQKDMYDWGLNRFIKEARILAKFKHSNIVRVFSVFEQNNTAYMVMEYEKGKELTHLYKQEGPLSEQRLLSIYLPISQGLKLIHDSGFIHRDIKPANIYLRQDESPVLLDFGSARKVSGSQTQMLTSLVTPGYAPFEQFNEGDDKQGPWTDIYALGASLYYGVTGQLPTDSLARGSSLLSTGTDSYQPLSPRATGEYSPQFLGAIDAALVFRSNERPQNVIDWAEMLSGKRPLQNLPQYNSPTPNHDDGDTTIIRPRRQTRHATALTSSLPATTSAWQTMRTMAASSAAKPWKQNIYVWLGAGLTTVVLLFGSINFLFTADGELSTSTPTPVVESENIQSNEAPQASIDIIVPEMDPNVALVNSLLSKANVAIDLGNSFEPTENNAIYYYQQVLEVDPINQTAAIAIQQMVSLFASEIRSDIAAGDYELVTIKIAILRTVKGSSAVVAELHQDFNLAKSETLKAEAANSQKSVDMLLQTANELLAKGKRIKPKRNNALLYYKKVLKSEADNQDALDGINKISQYFISRAKKNLTGRRLGKLARDIKIAESIDPKSQSLPKLKKQLKAQRKKVAKLLKQAKLAFDKDRLIKPKSKNSFYYYNRVFKYDRNSSKAKQGIKKTNARLQSIFDKNMSAGKYKSAETTLKSIESALPRSSLAKTMRVTFSTNEANPLSDIAMSNQLIGKFKRYFDAGDVNALNNILEFRKGLSAFLHSFFENYPTYKLKLSNLKFIRKQRSASAEVKISGLINKDGARVQAGDWSRFRIISKLNKHGRWKINWESTAKAN